MKDIGLKTKMFGIRQDKITYFNLKLKVKVTLTSFDSNTPSCLNIYIHTKQGRDYPKMKCTQICLKVWWRVTKKSDPPPPRRGGLTAGGLWAA